MLINILRLVLGSVAGVLTFCLLLRTLMQWVRIHPSNPLSPFVFSLTDWLVKPLRKGIPGVGGIDWASVLGAFLVSLAYHGIIMLLVLLNQSMGVNALAFFGVTISASIFWVLKNFVYLLMGIVFVQIVLSWVNPFSPMAAIMNELSKPFLSPLRRWLPPIGQVDLSPMVFILLLQIAMMVLESIFPM
jgi:YggT family protein